MLYFLSLICVLLGVALDRYLLPLMDLYLQKKQNKFSLDAIELQKQVNQVENSIVIDEQEANNELAVMKFEIEELLGAACGENSNTSIIGFKQNELEEEQEDIHPDERNTCKKIGFLN